MVERRHELVCSRQDAVTDRPVSQVLSAQKVADACLRFRSRRKTWGERTSPSRPDTHPQAPERRAREALTHTWAAYTRGDAEYSGKLHHDTTFPIAPSTLVVSLCLPAQVYRGWPAAAVARPFRMRSPASLDASVTPTAGPAWRCPAPPRSAHRLGLRARSARSSLPLRTPVSVFGRRSCRSR